MKIWCYNMNMSTLTNFNNKEGNKMPEIIQITKLAIRLDDTGELKELPYEYVYEFHGNFTIVGKNECEGIINSEGIEIAPVKYPKGLWNFLSCYDNIIKVDGNIAIVEKNEKYGLINIEKREEIIPLGLKGKEFLEKLREFPN